MFDFINRYPWLVPTIACIVYLLAIPVDIMEIDSAQYACMARELIERNDYLHFYDRGVEYLDKPPFIFWITALFYKIFGVGEFAFKMPSILFSLAGIYSTYRFTLLYYDRQTASLAAAVLATTQGYFHFNNDVRTDSYLTNSTIMAVWMFAAFLNNPRWFWWVGGAVMTGIAMLAKGPIGLMVPVLAFSTHFFLTRSWGHFFRWQWMAALVVIVLVLSPMMIGLYQQFDLQPEKWVNGRQGVSGLRFFFWEQSFGRITGENVWKNDAGPFFFVHNIAWSFLPWSIPLFIASGSLIIGFFSKAGLKLPQRNEWISAGAFFLPFLALSTSKYKLPHYIYVVFPFAAVVTADWLIRVFRAREWKGLRIAQHILLFGCWLFAGLIFIWFFPLKSPLLITVALAALGVCIYTLFRRSMAVSNKFMIVSVTSVIAVNILMALHFYPSILSYQAPGVIAKTFDSLGVHPKDVYHFGVSGRSMDFYAQHVIPEISAQQIDSLIRKGQRIIIHTNEEGLKKLRERGVEGKLMIARDNYSVTLLTMNFGNPRTRNQVTGKNFLVALPN